MNKLDIIAIGIFFFVNIKTKFQDYEKLENQRTERVVVEVVNNLFDFKSKWTQF